MGTHTAGPRPGRLALLDTVRGATVLSMIAFHACYDAAYIYGLDMPWFAGTALQAAWRSSISWTFLLLAGWMASLSRSNAKRAARYGLCAAAIWAATSLASVDTPISFGIMYCMAASTALAALARPLIVKTGHPAAWVALCLALFWLTAQVPKGTYPFSGLAWLGLPGTGFASGDYYPLIPYFFMYAAGSFAASAFMRSHPDGAPAWIVRDPLPPVTALGRHALGLYILHQPILLVVFELALG